MRLHWSPRSPFVRKVMIVLHECGLAEQVTLERSLVIAQKPPNANVLEDNPLGKIPVLVCDDGTCLFDSRVIAEYLNDSVNGGLFPSDHDRKYRHLRWQALGDGLTDILLLWRTELSRDTVPWQGLADGWRRKVQQTMSRLESEVPDLLAESFGIGQIAVICALGQMDFRWPDCDWRRHFPALARAEAQWADRPSVKLTIIRNDEEEDTGALTAGWLHF